MHEEENIESEFMKRLKTNPFRTPDHYFDTIEVRVMRNIEHQTIKKTSSAKVIRFLKPVLGIAASLAIVYLLVHTQINHFSTQSAAKAEISDSTFPYLMEDSALNMSSIDENTLINAIFSDEKSSVSDINPDEMLAYLSSGLNEVEIYSEIQN